MLKNEFDIPFFSLDDYIKNNDKAKKLPDKVVNALTRYIDHIEKEESKKNNGNH